MRVLGLSSYPVEAAATRFRLAQFVEPLSRRGIELTVSPFLDSDRFRELYGGGSAPPLALGLARSVLGRARDIFKARRYDLIFVQREAMFFGPAVFESLYQKAGRLPMVLDLDDATYVPYVSPTYGRIGSFFKFFGKTDNLIGRAETVVCGNRYIAEYVESRGKRAVVIPTVVDTEVFKPAERVGEVPVMGWIGTHSTFPFLESIFPVLERLAAKHRFRLKIVGSGRDEIKVAGVEVENVDWDLDSEVADFQSLDIGLYPITTSDSANEKWLLGKSGFKAIQYMAVGVPFVMTPVGVCAEIGEAGETHLNAETADDWYNSLERLLQDAGLRAQMGRAARAHAVSEYSLSRQTEKMANVFEEVLARR